MNKPNEFISWKFPWGAVTCVKSTMKKKKSRKNSMKNLFNRRLSTALKRKNSATSVISHYLRDAVKTKYKLGSFKGFLR